MSPTPAGSADRAAVGPTGGRVRAVAIIALSALVLCAGAMLTAGRAAAVWLDLTTAQSAAGYLRLESTPETPQWIAVRAGQDLHWLITAALDDAESASLELELRAEGSLVVIDGLTVEVSSCAEPFAPNDDPDLAPVCPGLAAAVQPPVPLAEVASNLDGGRYRLAELHRDAPRHLLVTLGVPVDADATSVATGTARVGVGLHAADTGRGVAPRSDLTATGADSAAIALLGLGGLGLTLGAVLLRRAAGRRGDPAPDEAAR